MVRWLNGYIVTLLHCFIACPEPDAPAIIRCKRFCRQEWFRVLFLFFILYSFTSASVYAAVGHSQDYQIPPLGSPKESREILGKSAELEIGDFELDGYILRPGFASVYSEIPFSLTVPDLTIDFGILSPSIPATQSHQLSISLGSATGFQLITWEDHPLESTKDSATIPDTLGDTGACTEELAQPWTSNRVYGFGFNAAGDNVLPDFIDSTYYRQFANRKKAEIPQVIVSHTSSSSNPPATSRKVTVTYKVNVPQDQPRGGYLNEITFVAVPKY